ncbi:GspH/FimT family pseudopilin [Gallaecimonas sp. GXIMD1310]|uniref:GspH/FimT family pseudopilin n=1 Tax=Gallaecimonas sp. GXIMD1310 TaxID=3131926 RepID=UPI003251B441
MKQRGFTLVELMVTLLVAGILVTISYPSLSRFFRDNQLSSQASELQSLLVTARNYALSYQVPVVVCPLSGSSCTSSWGKEITAFADTNGNGQKDGSDETLLTMGATTLTRYFSQSSIRYTADGTLASTPGTVELCEGSDNTLYNGVVITLSGRSRTATDDNDDGVRDDDAGASIDCH